MTLQEKISPNPQSVSAEHVSPMAEQIPEAKGLTSIDTFYDRKKGIVAVFDVDFEQVSKQQRIFWPLLMVLLLPLCLVLVFFGELRDDTTPTEWMYVAIFAFLGATQLAAADKEDQSGGKDHHVAITTEGVRVDPNPSMSVTTKFQSIESCELATSGAIHVKSTRSPKVGRLVGLRNPLCGVLRPEECVKVVQAMKKRHCDGFPAFSMLRKSDYRDIPETQHLTWKDPFYDGNDSIIAVFDRDNDAVRRGTNAEKLAPFSIVILLCIGMFWAIIPDPTVNLLLTGIFLFYWTAMVAAIYFLFLRNLGEDQHVAVTSEGIRLDHGPHYFVTLPYDSFSTCQAIPCDDIFANMVSPGLKQITLTGPSKERRGTPQVDMLHKLLTGIEQAQEFADLVMAMKREQESETSVDSPGGYEGVLTPDSVQIV